MNTANSYALIQIGLLTRWLMIENEPVSVKNVIEHLNRLETELKKAQLFVSLSALTNLNKLKDAKKELSTLEKNVYINAELSKKVNDEMQIIQQIIFSESLTKKIYYMPQRRYNGEYLLDDPAKILKPNIFGKLSDIAKYDFASACRCITFGEATASAFHILRATEDTLKEYYFKYKKTKRLAKPMWGPMTNELRQKNNPKPSESILNALDLVRTSYRNPTQHPQAIYDIDSCQDLFGVCVDLINKMGEEL